jgi:hypothetical protein
MAIAAIADLTTQIVMAGTSTGAVSTVGALTTGVSLAAQGTLSLNTTGFLESLGFPPTFPATAHLDQFNRADQGPPPSASWVTCAGSGWRVLANFGAPASGGILNGATWNNSFASTQEVYFTIANSAPASSGYVGCFVRLQSPTNLNSDHYELRAHLIAGLNNDVLRLFKVIGGVTSQIGIDIALGADLQLAGGDQLGLRCDGTTLTVWLNGVLKRTATDSSLNAPGYIGLVNGVNAGDVMADNFGGGAGATVEPTPTGDVWAGRGSVYPHRNSLVNA